MRVVLRILAIAVGVEIIQTVSMVWYFWSSNGLKDLAAEGTFGWATFLGWFLTMTLGLFGATQLWRLLSSGRIALSLLAAFAVLYYSLGWLLIPQTGTGALSRIGLQIAGNIFLIAILLSPPARRACLR